MPNNNTKASFNKIREHPIVKKISFFLKSYLWNRRALYISAFVLNFASFYYASYLLPQQFAAKKTRSMRQISLIKIPKFLRKPIFNTYSWWYQVNKQDFVQQIDTFENLSQFFTRKVHPRSIEQNHSILISPADSRILKIQEITQDSCQIIKNVSYSLGEFLLGCEYIFSKEEIQTMKVKSANNKLYEVIFYLAPGDYHRFHAPCDFEIKLRKNIEGTYYSVKQSSLLKHKKVYEKNSRVCMHSQWKEGYLGLVFVGAMNVSQIEIDETKTTIQKGAEIGLFNLGSTIVMIFEAKNIKQWLVKEGEKVAYGQPLCEVE